jgi:hypothetical protein
MNEKRFLTGIGAGAAGTIVAPAGALAQESGALAQIESVTVAPARATGSAGYSIGGRLRSRRPRFSRRCSRWARQVGCSMRRIPLQQGR